MSAKDYFLFPFRLIYVFFCENFCFVYYFYLYKKRDNPFDVYDQSNNNTPIILVHGNHGNQTQFLYGKKQLLEAGYTNIFSFNYHNHHENFPIEQFVKKLQEKIQYVSSLLGTKEIILVAHSMGGLLSSYYAENLAQTDGITIKRVITIATPWQGSYLLKIMPPIALEKIHRFQQMNPGSSFLQELIEKKQPFYRYIGILLDQLVFYPNCFPTNDPQDPLYKTFYHLGHLGCLQSASVWKEVDRWIREVYLS